MTIFRPTLSRDHAEDPIKISKLVKWFLAHDKETKKRFWHSRHILETLLIAGYVPKEHFEPDGVSYFTENPDCYGLPEFVASSIWKKLHNLKIKGGGKIRKENFKELLDGLYGEIERYVTLAKQLGYDMYKEFNKNFYRTGFYPWPQTIETLKLYFPKEKVHETVKEIIENQLLDSRKSRLIATLWLSKVFLEVVACILCWLYIIWFHERYVDPYTAEAAGSSVTIQAAATSQHFDAQLQDLRQRTRAGEMWATARRLLDVSHRKEDVEKALRGNRTPRMDE